MQLQDIKNPCKSYKHKCEHPYLFKDINLIPLLQASVNSSLISCHYYFKAKSKFCSFFSITHTPVLDIPIIIYIPDIRSNIQIFQPHNWNPQIMSNIEITFITFEDSKLVIKQNRNTIDVSRTEYFNASNSNSDGMNNNYSSLNLRECNRKQIFHKQSCSDQITNEERSYGKVVPEYKSSADSNTDRNLLALLQNHN